ncbi:CLUMA_CG017374, isoform A [Clunio marinus]|uniref:CLUMA_CG017374, isoform A n=1 Tax=Clunio marinus TaxID=568069 RepID=A0A1J1IXH1_9DIPT|nr:CLUMA_CG017374, isoform A [Clunio marinus]
MFGMSNEEILEPFKIFDCGKALWDCWKILNKAINNISTLMFPSSSNEVTSTTSLCVDNDKTESSLRHSITLITIHHQRHHHHHRHALKW